MSYPGYPPNQGGYPTNPYPPNPSGYPPIQPPGFFSPNPGPSESSLNVGFGSTQPSHPTPYPNGPVPQHGMGGIAMHGGQHDVYPASSMPQVNPGYGSAPTAPPYGYPHVQAPQATMPMPMPMPELHQAQIGYQPPFQQPYPSAAAYHSPGSGHPQYSPHPPNQHSPHPHYPTHPPSHHAPIVAAAAASNIVKKTAEDEKDKKPTVKPISDFSATVDCERLKKSMKGLGCDEKTITSILSTRSNSQRVIISATYKSLYGKDLIKEMKGELSGDYEDLVIALMTPLPEFMANQLHKAIKGAGTDETTLIQILCTANNLELKDIKEAYHKLYGKSLESAVVNDTSGDLKRLLVAVIQGSRSENRTANVEEARADADQLYKAGEGTWGTSESTFFSIFANRSYAQLRKIDECYINKTGHSLEKAIKKEFSGFVQKGLKTILLVAHNKPAYFADVIRKATKGSGTKEKVLIRVIATRCEIDLGFIKEQYKIKHGKNMEDVISSETSGDFKKLLLALCGHHKSS